MSGILDSNQRPQRPERRALPAALIPVKILKCEAELNGRWKRTQGPEPVNSKSVKKQAAAAGCFRIYRRESRSCANTRKIHTYKKSLPDWKALARVTGLEPVISGVTGQRDNQLRYTRVMFNNIYSSLILVNRSKHKFAKKIIFFYLCSPIIFSIQIIEYQRPNFLAQSLKVPTVAKPICW